MKENMMETVINTTAKKKKIFFLAVSSDRSGELLFVL